MANKTTPIATKRTTYSKTSVTRILATRKLGVLFGHQAAINVCSAITWGKIVLMVYNYAPEIRGAHQGNHGDAGLSELLD